MLIRDDLRGYVIDAFGDPDAVLIADETADIKKGRVCPLQRPVGQRRRVQLGTIRAASPTATRHTCVDRPQRTGRCA